MVDENNINEGVISDEARVCILYILIVTSSLSLIIPPVCYLFYEYDFSLQGDPHYIFNLYIKALETFNRGFLSFVEPLWFGLPVYISTILACKGVLNENLVRFLFWDFVVVLLLSAGCFIFLESKNAIEVKVFKDFIDDGKVLIEGFKMQLKVCVQLSISYLGVITGVKVAS